MNFEHTKGLVFGVGLDFKLIFFLLFSVKDPAVIINKLCNITENISLIEPSLALQQQVWTEHQV